MDLGKLVLCCLALLLIYSTEMVVIRVSGQAEGLSVGYYDVSCPNAELIARQTLRAAVNRDPTATAALLRLVFHDCQVHGCDASILLKPTANMTAETASEKNFGIRRLDFIDQIKTVLEAACPNTVSCADIIVMAARDSIFFTSGPFITIETGRRDATFTSSLAADRALPPATVPLDDMRQTFAAKGLDIGDSVALLGAHTLGVGHCINFVNRLNPPDPLMSPLFSTALKFICRLPSPLNNFTFAPNDLTNLVFDNQYFRDLLARRGLLTVDSEIVNDPRTVGFVSQFAANQPLFFQRFTSAFVKLTRFNVLTGTTGQIRNRCGFLNP
ncbi:hypothetical protein O6H91_02G010800 [Diphasiastrum complanatum]|uniref:Uncharacterized protein n=1 Tax=Diphasiastrum complanatum TaxID=34168 RepID=A0ACC2ECX0_DIPCM|nr:hypothetical protein O6H91_02G010800 [Diphasiastrum complanatum]